MSKWNPDVYFRVYTGLYASRGGVHVMDDFGTLIRLNSAQLCVVGWYLFNRVKP